MTGDVDLRTSTTAAPPSAYALRGVGLTVGREESARQILTDIELDIEAGEIVSIVGRSGTGKTSLLRILGGLFPNTEGSVLSSGVEVTGPPSSVVTVFQDYTNALLPWRSVERNVALGLERRMGRKERAVRIADVLRLVGLEGRGGDYPWQLSGGMQQRVQIARALALDPQVLLMDEPFGALDAMTKASLQDQLLQVQERTGATVILVTHDMEEAIYLSDRVLVIAGSPGKIVADYRTNLPRPRNQLTTRELPEYLEARHALAEELRVGGST